MKRCRYVVLAERARGFDTIEEARTFAAVHSPAVICERREASPGVLHLVEVARRDFLYDRERQEWRVKLG